MLRRVARRQLHKKLKDLRAQAGFICGDARIAYAAQSRARVEGGAEHTFSGGAVIKALYRDAHKKAPATQTCGERATLQNPSDRDEKK